MQIDSSIFCFHNLCVQVQSDTSTSTKQDILKGFLQAYKGDVGLLYKFLLPKYNGRLYHLQDKQLIRLFSAAIGVPESTLRTHLQQSGCIATTVQHFFKPRVPPQGNCHLYTGLTPEQGGIPGDHPMKKGFSKLTLENIDDHLEKLSSNGSDLSQLSCIQAFLNVACKHALFAYLRQIKQDLKLGAGVQTLLAGLHPTAGEIFKVCANIQQVVQMVMNPPAPGGGLAANAAPHYTAAVGGHTAAAGGVGAPLIGSVNSMISMFTPVRPMLAAPSKGVDHVLSKCPNGAFSETKYDGERIQIHMKKAPNGQRQYAFFARSLKTMKADKYEGLQKYFEEAVAGMDSCILDGEILLVDKASSQPLPFGTLGKHKKMQFQSACTCIFIFDILYVNGHSLLTVPMVQRREEMKKHVRFIQNRVMISEMRVVEGNPQQRQAIMERHLKYAVAEGLEGLVIKDMLSVYEPGSRHWIKLKKDYLAGMADSADMVVLGAWYGSGSKGGILSTFLMGVWDKSVPAGGYQQFKTVCKVGNGHDDMTLTAISNDLLQNGKVFSADNGQGKGLNNPIWIDIHNSVIPDVYIKDPMKHSPIWEISAAEFSATKTHSASGISMRFPRVTRIRNDKDVHTATNLKELEALYQTSQIKGSKLGTLAAQHGGAGGLAAFSASGLSPQHYFADPNSDDRHEKGVMMRVSSAYNYGPGVVKPDGSLPVVEGQRFGQIDALGVALSSKNAPGYKPPSSPAAAMGTPPTHHQQAPAQQQQQQLTGLPPGWGGGGGGDMPAPAPPQVSPYQTYLQSLPAPPTSKVFVLSTRPSNCNTTLTGAPTNQDSAAPKKKMTSIVYSPGDPSQPLANAEAPHESIVIVHPVALRPSLSPNRTSDKEHEHVSHGISWSKKGTMGGISQFVGDEPQDAYDYYLALSGQPLPPQPGVAEPKTPPYYFAGKPTIGDVLITECSNNRNQGRVFVASVLCQRLVQSVDPASGVASTSGVSTDVGAFERSLQHIVAPFALQFNCGSLHIAKLSMPYYKQSESWGTVDGLLRKVIIPGTGLRCVVYDRKMQPGSAKRHDIAVDPKPYATTVPIVAGEKKKSSTATPSAAPKPTSLDAEGAMEHVASPESLLLSNPTMAQPLQAAVASLTAQPNQTPAAPLLPPFQPNQTPTNRGGERSPSVASHTSSLDSPTTRIRRQVHRLSTPDKASWALRCHFPLLGHRVVLSKPTTTSLGVKEGDAMAATRQLICTVVLFGGYVQSKWKVSRSGDKRDRDSGPAATPNSLSTILDALVQLRVSAEVATTYNVTGDAVLDAAYSPALLKHFQEAVSSPLLESQVNDRVGSCTSSPAATVKQYGRMLLGATQSAPRADSEESTVMFVPVIKSNATAAAADIRLDIGLANAARTVGVAPLSSSSSPHLSSIQATPSEVVGSLQRVLKLGGVIIPVMCNTPWLEDENADTDDTNVAGQQQQICSIETLVGLLQRGTLSAMSRALRSRNRLRHRARAARDSEVAAGRKDDVEDDSSTEEYNAAQEGNEETSSVSDVDGDVDNRSRSQLEVESGVSPVVAAKVLSNPTKWPTTVLNLHGLDEVAAAAIEGGVTPFATTPVAVPIPAAHPQQASSPTAPAITAEEPFAPTLMVAEHDEEALFTLPSSSVHLPSSQHPNNTSKSSPPPPADYPSYAALVAKAVPAALSPSQLRHVYGGLLASILGSKPPTSPHTTTPSLRLSPIYTEGLGEEESAALRSKIASVRGATHNLRVSFQLPSGSGAVNLLLSGDGASVSCSSATAFSASIPAYFSTLTTGVANVLGKINNWERSVAAGQLGKQSSHPPALVFQGDKFLAAVTGAVTSGGEVPLKALIEAMYRPPCIFGCNSSNDEEKRASSNASTVVHTDVDAASTDVEQ